MKTIVTVTPFDILSGIRGDSLFCPVALAASRAFGRPMQVGFEVITDGHCVSYVPPVITDWIEAFDRGFPVPAIRFVV